MFDLSQKKYENVQMKVTYFNKINLKDNVIKNL